MSQITITSIILGLALVIGFYRKVQIESQLETTKGLLAAIVASSDDAIISKTLDGIITSWNAGAERLFGYNAEEAIGQHVTLIIPPDRHGEEHQIMNRMQQGQRSEHFETVRMTKDGRRVSISLTVSPILGENIQIVLDLGTNIWPIVADPVQLDATLTNLATNARDAMPNGGQLTFTTSNRCLDADYSAHHPEVAPGDYTVIEVSDTGTGLPPEIINHIFEPFFSTKEHGKGTGLGLSMAFGFMRQSGGHINVYSTVQSGTTFRLYFPRATQEVISAISTPASQYTAGHETILVVEDNKSVRLIVTRQLTELGYHVLEAANADEALELLAANKVDLIFSDIVMPGKLNGRDLAQMAIERWPSTKVVLTSGFPETKSNGHADATTNLRLLHKPYRKNDLACALRDVLEDNAKPAKHFM